MMDGPDFEIDGLEAAEGALDGCEIFVGPDGGGGIERFGLKVGAQDIDAVEHGLGVDLFGLALERQIIVGDGDGEVFGHLVMVDHRTDRERDFILAAQRFFVASGAALNVEQFLHGGIEQLAPFARTLVGEQRSLLERASFDPLTKLPNRGEFERRAADAIANAERQGTEVCLLLFDLNGFKMVNDTYGHHAGDEMLRVVGSRLRKAVRDDDIVARWGGDEFVVMMPGIGDLEMATKRAQQLAEQVAGRTRLEGVAEALRVRVSVGVAIWPRHGAELQSLVEASDQAMYQAKRDGETWHVADEVTQLPLQRVPA